MMAIFSHVFWWTGAIVWFVICLLLLWLMAEIVWGGIVTFSWIRFAAKMARSQGIEVPAWKVFFRFFYRWPEFIAHRNNGSETHEWPAGIWRGVGDWQIHKKFTAAPILSPEEQKK